ncbi:MAG: hypothetical protein EHM23_22445 [Acidobacteria bacterium]|nr:MAG: hypothetical protein EHM23_22445 [Acidobacteriota bacterium]
MTTSKAVVLLALTGLCGFVAHAQSSRPEPHIGYLYPAGGQQGAVFQITAGGQSLRGASRVYVSGEGVRARVLHHYPALRNLDREQRQELQRRFRELRQKRLAEAAGGDPAALAPRRARGAQTPTNQPTDKPVELPDYPLFQNWEKLSLRELEGLSRELLNLRKRQPNAQISEIVEIEISINAGAPPGDRELRVETPAGLTNPLCFQVGLLPETREIEINDPSASSNLPKAPALDVPILINGRIKSGDVDRCRLKVHRGQNLVVNVQARRLIPYLADAVPGWFQPIVALYGAAGKEVSFADDYRFNPDPVLFYRIPDEGEYELEIRDSLYRGRDDFVYRIAIGELPFITHMFPLGGRRGTSAHSSIAGWNLPGDRVSLNTSGGDDRLREIELRDGHRLSNSVPYAVDTEPDGLEAEPNEAFAQAQRLSLPMIVNARVARAGDIDYFKIKGRAGEELVAEVWARRLNSPVDSLVRLLDTSGKVLGWNDDHEDKEMGLLTHHADSYLRARLLADGDYYLQVTDSQNQGGEAYVYRLHVGPPQPDFALRVSPSSLNTFAGGSVPLAVHAVRKDGFEGDIELVVKDAPAGFRISGGRIPAGRDSIRMTLTAPAHPFPEPVSIQLEGRARIAGQLVARRAIPCEDMMQAFLYQHLVPARELLVAVRGAGNRRRVVPPIAIDGPIQVPLGGTTQVRINTGRTPALDSIQLELHNAPAGLSLQEVKRRSDGVDLVIKTDASLAKTGVDNLIVGVYMERAESQQSDAKTSRRQNRRLALGVLPAIPIEIVTRD